MSISTNGWGTNSHDVPSRAGLILLDSTGRPVHGNGEAIGVLSYPRQGRNLEQIVEFFPREIQALLHRLGNSHGANWSAAFMSGRRHYVCRAFALPHHSGMPSRMLTGVLIERVAPKSVNIAEVAERFHLTQREQEAIGLLARGLTSKEIATRMNISANTVKTFFRLIMTKLGVSTRSGVLGKIAYL